MKVRFYLVRKRNLVRDGEELIVHQNLKMIGTGLDIKYLLSKI